MVNLGMSEYISKEYIRNITQKHWDDSCGAECYAYSAVLDDIDEAPIADVVEVKHGHWIIDEHGHVCDVKCSVCEKEYACHYGMLKLQNFSYCPNCGAKMI